MTQSGLYLAPFAVAMAVVAPVTGRLSKVFGSKLVLVAGSLFAAASYLLLLLNHSDQWAIYASTGILGVGIAMGFAGMSNLIIEAVPAEQTGVATGMNTNIRNIGAALGSGIATSLVVSGLLARRHPRGARLPPGLRGQRSGAGGGGARRAPDPEADRSFRRCA